MRRTRSRACVDARGALSGPGWAGVARAQDGDGMTSVSLPRRRLG